MPNITGGLKAILEATKPLANEGRAAFLKQWGGNKPVQRASIKELQEKVKQQRGNYGSQRVERAADKVPNLEQQYTQRAIEKAFLGQGGDNATGVMVFNPKDFEEYAKPIAPNALERLQYKQNPITGEWVTAEQYTSDLAKHIQDMGASEVPYLQLQRTDNGSLRIAGHEGRHRMRALDQLGDQSTLVEMIPGHGVRESIPRSSQEEYISNLASQLGLDPTVSPEVFPNVKLPLPQIFKKGGAVVGHENEYVKKAGDFSRKSQQWAASLVPGLQSVITDANQPYYPRDTDHNGAGDAMRHLLLQAGLVDKYGEVPAGLIGWLHEMSSPGQPDAEYDMDAHNDGLGRQLGGLGLTKEELVRRAKGLVDSGAATTIPQGEDGYYKGGLVK